MALQRLLGSMGYPIHPAAPYWTCCCEPCSDPAHHCKSQDVGVLLFTGLTNFDQHFQLSNSGNGFAQAVGANGVPHVSQQRPVELSAWSRTPIQCTPATTVPSLLTQYCSLRKQCVETALIVQYTCCPNKLQCSHCKGSTCFARSCTADWKGRHCLFG